MSASVLKGTLKGVLDADASGSSCLPKLSDDDRKLVESVVNDDAKCKKLEEHLLRTTCKPTAAAAGALDFGALFTKLLADFPAILQILKDLFGSAATA